VNIIQLEPEGVRYTRYLECVEGFVKSIVNSSLPGLLPHVSSDMASLREAINAIN
jgi:hypothetical protein